MAANVAQVTDSFIALKKELIKDRKEDRKAVVDELLRLFSIEIPEDDADGRASRSASVAAVLDDLGFASSVRLRDTTLTDKRVDQGMNITVSVMPTPQTSFGFGLNQSLVQRDLSETEIEGLFAFPTSEFAAQLLQIVKGDSQIAILEKLSTLMQEL